MSPKVIVIAIIVCLWCLMDLSYAGDKGGSNIVLQDKHSQIILNSGGKKGGENIIIKDNKCCGHKQHVKYVYIPVYTHHAEHHGWGHEQQHWGGWHK